MANETKEPSIATDTSQQNGVSDPLGLEQAASVSVQQDDTAEKASAGEDTAAEGVKAEDELWDEGSAFEEVPLFEEFASKIAAAESKPKDIVEELSSELEAAVADQEQAVGIEKTEESGGDELQSDASSSSILPWVISGIACLFMLSGAWVFWRMYANLSVPAGPVGVQQHVQVAAPSAHKATLPPVAAQKPAQTNPVEAPVAPKISQGHNPANEQRLVPLEYISLAPFLIPAQQGGEPVFFKLQVELICRDKQMKEELTRKETWVRDAIYREMKGIDLSAGVQENDINRFRRPILDRINRELAPLYVDDVRLMGTLLK